VIEDLQKLEELEPGSDLDDRVRRRMHATMAVASQRRPVPFLPFEGAIYAVVLGAYVVYAGARAVQLFHEGRAPHVLHVALAVVAAHARTGDPDARPPAPRASRPIC
jgi:hypothetical protein